MAYISTNSNPYGNRVGDCTVRAISTALGKEWGEVYLGLALKGLTMGDMPSSNRVWGEYLHDNGFKRTQLPETCPYCYTVREFCNEHPQGVYVLGTGEHAVAVVGGNYMDSWDSGQEQVLVVWTKEGA